MNKVEVLDCTLRDGSYLINFQFNTNDTFHISRLLEKAGIKYIEVGHGLGLDAGKDKGSSLENDLDYIKSAKKAVTTSKIGVFYIPGIGNMDSIKKGVEAGLDFIRIGVNVTDFEQARATIEYAKGLGLEVWLNLMKSYTVSIEEWTTICKDLKTFKCDHLAVVDSAGGMLPNDVKKFCQVAKEHTPFNVGFHGHNNMQLAVANCLAAIEGGATIVDGTLFGMGRSGGNASTEILAAIFQREGWIPAKYDVESLIEVANEIIAPMARRNLGDGAVELSAGLNYFHSSFFKTVKTSCDREQASVFRTILNLPLESRKFVTKEMVDKTILDQGQKSVKAPLQPLKKSSTLYLSNLDELAKYLREIVGKTNRKVAMSVSRTSNLSENFRISDIFTLEDSIVGHVEVSNYEHLKTLMDSLTGLVSTWVLDRNFKSVSLVGSLNPYFYDEEQLERSVLNNELLNTNRKVYRAKVSGQQVELIADSEYEVAGASIGNVIVVGQDVSVISPELIKQLSPKDQIVLTHKCQIIDECWKLMQDKDIIIFRLNYTLSLAYEIEKIVKYRELVQDGRGKTTKGGVEIVSGGVLGRKGNIIVDNIVQPSIILGIADGEGGVKKLPQESNQLEAIRNSLFSDMQ